MCCQSGREPRAAPSGMRRAVSGPRRQWAVGGTELVRTLTREPATSTPMVPTTMRWIHCFASSADFASTAVIFHRKANMKANAPIDPTRAWPICVQVRMRSVIGATFGVVSRMCMRTSLRFAHEVMSAEAETERCLLTSRADASLDAVQQDVERRRLRPRRYDRRLHARLGLLCCALVEAHLHCPTADAQLVPVRRGRGAGALPMKV